MCCNDSKISFMHKLINTCFKSAQLGLRMSLLFCGFVKESSLNCHQTATQCFKHEIDFKNACNTIVFLSKFCFYSSRGVRNRISPTKMCQRYFIKTHFSFFSGMGYPLGVLFLHFILETTFKKIPYPESFFPPPEITFFNKDSIFLIHSQF